MAIAIITGASSGLGKAYVDAIVAQYPMIDEFWLIARRKDKLKEVADLHKDKTVAGICLDLSQMESFSLFRKLLREKEPEIKVLINAAGFGQVATFFTSDEEKQASMIDLNCRALTVMTRICLPYMIEDSLVINVSSVSAFVPMPRFSVYAATKSYVHSLSKALRQELLPRGINVLSVCPGVMDTEFFDTAFEPEGLSKQIDAMPRVFVKDIAEKSLKAGRKRRAFYTNGLYYKAFHFIAKLVPHNILIRFMNI